MEETNFAQQYRSKLFGDTPSALAQTDPEFTAFFERFAFDDAVNQSNLDDKTRMLAILATLLGCQGTALFGEMAKAALRVGVTPIALKETVYQATAYLGIGRVYPFLRITNEVLTAQGIDLPLAPQGTTNQETRLAAGSQAQVDIFGEQMREFYRSGPEQSRHINRWLAENCFGDYYTRSGLDLRERELITFCFLSAQGGCEPQLTSHAAANLRLGNDKTMLIAVISQCLPYIGYPRSLNALRCVEEASK